MGRRSAEAEENHWPGFVDALSTIVMVVTFLLIILAVAIFVLAQNVAKSNIESQAQKTKQGGGDKTSSESFEASKEAKGSEKTEPVVTAAESAPKVSDKKEEYVPDLASELTAEVPLKATSELAVLSREAPKEERMVVASVEADKDKQASKVTTASSIITLEFDNVNTKIDDETSKKIKTFLEEEAANEKNTKITIWSFANSKAVSVSSAKRIAYYRALSARNEFMNNGYDPENISVEIRFAPNEQEENTVRVVLQP